MGERSGIYCGLYRDRPIWYTGASHVLGYGPTGSGKGAGVLIPLVKTYPGSLFVHDPSFQIAAATARYRSQFSNVILINPCQFLADKIPHLASHGCNFMARGPLNCQHRDFVPFYDYLARNSTEPTPQNQFWYGSSVNIKSAFYMYQRMHMGQHATMTGVRRMMLGHWFNWKTRKTEDIGLDGIIQKMYDLNFEPIRAKIGNFRKNDETRANVFKHIESEMGCFDFPFIRDDDIYGKSYNFEISKHRSVTIYFGLPTSQDGCQVWKKLILGSILYDLVKDVPGDIDPVIVVDEADDFGTMPCIPEFLRTGRKHGGRMVHVWQDPKLIDNRYGQQAGLVKGSRGAFWSLPPNETEHADYIRLILGKRGVWSRNYAAHTLDNAQSSAGLTDAAQYFDLMNNAELMGMKNEMIGIIQPVQYPIRIQVEHYYNVPWLKDGLDPDPYHDPSFRVFDQERIEYEFQEMMGAPSDDPNSTRLPPLEELLEITSQDDPTTKRSLPSAAESAALPAPEHT